MQTFLHCCQSYNLDKDHWFRRREMKVGLQGMSFGPPSIATASALLIFLYILKKPPLETNVMIFK
jgi:hypothetical protein